MIVFSGIDSAGKTTQVKRLVEKSKKKTMVVWSRGGYTSFFLALKWLIRRFFPKVVPAKNDVVKRKQILASSKIQKVWLFLAILDLIRLYCISLRIYKMFGYKLICDRYIWDSCIDFTLNFPSINFRDWNIWKFLTRFALVPDISIILTISVQESCRRSLLKNEPFPESEMQKVQRFDAYQKLIEANKWDYVINTDKDAEIVHQEISGLIGECCEDF